MMAETPTAAWTTETKRYEFLNEGWGTMVIKNLAATTHQNLKHTFQLLSLHLLPNQREQAIAEQRKIEEEYIGANTLPLAIRVSAFDQAWPLYYELILSLSCGRH